VTLIAATLAPDRAWLSSDTMLFGDDGRSACETFKFLLLPGARAVAAVTGPLDFGIALYQGLKRATFGRSRRRRPSPSPIFGSSPRHPPPRRCRYAHRA
jgi:hypothetical protein